MNRIIITTSNKGKLREYRDMLEPLGYEVVTAKELGIISDPEENGTTYAENAYIKAKDVYDKAHIAVVADDSGLEVTALDNEPGIYSSRYAKSFGDDYVKTAHDIFRRLEGKQDRSARFVCDICYIDAEGNKHIFEGICPGYITDDIKGTNGFGYDPIFHSDEADADFGLASEELKNAYSHRGKAARMLVSFLKGE